MSLREMQYCLLTLDQFLRVFCELKKELPALTKGQVVLIIYYLIIKTNGRQIADVPYAADLVSLL